MKAMNIPMTIEKWRLTDGPYGSDYGAYYGAFVVPGPCGRDLRIIASPGDADENIPWEHVSVSLANRCPNWQEMCFVKDLFWSPEEAVMQLHPPRSSYVNNHDYCLHLWRPMNGEIPLPPSIAVGVLGVTRNEMAGMSPEALAELRRIEAARK